MTRWATQKLMFCCLLALSFVCLAQASPEPCGYDVGQGFLSDAYAEARQQDQMLLKRFPGIATVKVSRLQRVLQLKLKSGQVAEFTDIPCDHSPSHSLVDHLRPQGYLVIHVSKWEEAELLFVNDQTGRRHRVAQSAGRVETPVSSPDGRHFLVMTNDFYAQSSTVQMWEFQKGGPRRVWRHAPVEWYPVSARWLDTGKAEVSGAAWVNEKLRRDFAVSLADNQRWIIKGLGK